jgi:hypothetical protein
MQGWLQEEIPAVLSGAILAAIQAIQIPIYTMLGRFFGH